MSKFEFTPSGVCCQKMIIDIDNDIINNVEFIGGCPGNLLGISQIIKGKSVNEVINAFDGVKCGKKPTSCPEQLSKAINHYLKQQNM